MKKIFYTCAAGMMLSMFMLNVAYAQSYDLPEDPSQSTKCLPATQFENFVNILEGFTWEVLSIDFLMGTNGQYTHIYQSKEGYICLIRTLQT